MKKTIIGLLISFMLMVPLSSCSGVRIVVSPEKEQDIQVKVGTIKGPTGMGMAGLLEKNETGEANLDYDFTISATPDELVAKVISKELDIAALPTNVALLLYNKTEGEVLLAAVNTMGVLYLLENGDSVNSMEDLDGETVGISGKGSIPDFVFRYLLEASGLEPDGDTMLDFTLEHADLAASLVSGDVLIGLLPQPHVTTALMRNKDLRIALDITEEWNKATDYTSELAMGCIVVQKEFAQKHKDILDEFLTEYEESVDFVNGNREEAAALIEKYEILPNAAIALNAIPYSNIVYVDAKDSIGFLNDLYGVLYDFEPKSIGGSLADEGFYYIR